MSEQVSLLASGALNGTTTGAGSASVYAPRGDKVAVLINVSTIGGTSPSYTFSVQWSNDNATWYDADTADSFTAITTVKAVTKSFDKKGRFMRLYRVVTGTTPTATVSADVMGIYVSR